MKIYNLLGIFCLKVCNKSKLLFITRLILVSCFILSFDVLAITHSQNASMNIDVKPGTSASYRVLENDIVALFTKTLQQTTITGVVTDESGEPIPGVNIIIKGGTTGTISDVNGKYLITVPDRETVLVFSFVGFITQEIQPGDRTLINIIFQEDSRELEEVVIVGYGIQKKINLTGAVSTVSSEKITSRPAMNLSSSLAGLAPGVRVTQGRGNPGDENVSINIRGIASINASSPMVLVDGVIAEMTVVNPDDVESISILKDAASAAIYGSRAANGVVLITTKKGRKGKPTVNASAMFAQEKAVTKLNFMSSTADWMAAHNRATNNNTPGNTLPYEQAAINEWRSADANPNGMYVNPVNGNTVPNWLAYPNTDWAREMFRPSFYHRYNLAVSGGGDYATYMLSTSYQDNPGSLENTGMQRFNLRANVESKVSDFLTIGTQTWATKEFKEPGNISMTYMSQAFPGINPKHDGLFGTSEDPNMAMANNVLHSIASAGGEREYTRINTTWFANADIWNGLSFEARFNYSEYQRQDNTYSQDLPRYRFRDGIEQPATGSELLEQATTSRFSYFSSSYTADFILRYTASFGYHDISAFAAYEQHYAKTSGFRLNAKGLLDWNVIDINSAGDMLDWGTDAEKRDAAKTALGMLSYFGRINYAYKGKYLAEVNLRSDGSSRFAPGNRWGTFPSFSLGWRLSEESFFSPAKDVVNNLKLKASYGSLGNQVSGFYDWQSIYIKKNNVFNESIQNGVVQSQLPNYALSWERTSTLNFGFESNFLKNRLGLDFDYFIRHTTDMLVNPPQYLTIGNVNSPRSNSAEMKNSGIDFNINWNDRIGDFRFFVGFNAFYNINEVTKYKGKLIYEADSKTPDIWGDPTWRYTNLADVSTSNDQRRIVEGHMVNEFFIRKPYHGNGSYMNSNGSVNPNGGPKDGMIRSKADLDWLRAMVGEGYSFNNKTIGTGAANIWYGDMIFADVNGDGKYGNDDDREFVGKSTVPKWVFGLNLSAEWKGFDLSMTWSGRLGSFHYIRARAANLNELTNTGDGVPWDALNKFYSYDALKAKDDPSYDPASDLSANHLAKFPRLLSATSTMVDNTFYLYNTSYLKLKNLQVGYTFPKNWLAQAKISNIRVFLTAENLLSFTHKDFPAVDPELGGGVNVYPIARMMSGGISVTF